MQATSSSERRLPILRSVNLLVAATDPQAPSFVSILKGFFDALFVSLWPLWLVVAGVGAIKVAIELYRLRRLASSGINEVDAMDGRTFEQFLATLFRRLGYRVETTRYQGDYGADLIVLKDRMKTAVQAKRWSKRVGVKAVQEAVAAKGYYGCDRALVVANRAFTDQARRLARANKVELWDREVLVNKLVAARAKEHEFAPSASDDFAPAPVHGAIKALVSTQDETTCVTCGTTISERVRDYCLARPQLFGGEVYCFRHQRAGSAAT
jgi:restriction system protein